MVLKWVSDHHGLHDDGSIHHLPAGLVGLIFGLGSSVSFPLGSLLAVLTTSPTTKKQDATAAWRARVRKQFAASTLAFGSGCLLFAVTVELYGEAMAELREDGYRQGTFVFFITVFSAMLGACIYVASSRWLTRMLAPEGVALLPPAPAQAKLASSPDSEVPFTRQSSHEFQRERLQSLVVGMETWFGVFTTGLPEGLFLGTFAAEQRLSVVLVVSLCVANFPAAYSSSVLLRSAGKSSLFTVSLWFLLFVLTGLLAGLMAWVMPKGAKLPLGLEIGNALIEGFAGGGMLACVASVMLPEAHHMQGDISGLFAVAGFLVSVVIKVFGGMAESWVV
mmetsp:Transcript_97999/g.277483  ORF Transcript_97999/g.277483 Transcript_97999/m.277483 type:complete len:335 (+) Transcript_97999:104-1108(+)